MDAELFGALLGEARGNPGPPEVVVDVVEELTKKVTKSQGKRPYVE